MARLTEVDVDFISLVKHGANKQKINIYKSDNCEPEITQENNEEFKGFFNVLKSFFNKSEEVKTVEELSNVKTFKDRMAEKDVLHNIWNVNDTLVSTIRDIVGDTNIKDKKQALSLAIDEHSDYLKIKIENINDIKKSTKLLQKGDEDLDKDEIVQIVRDTIKPLETKIAALEGDDTKEKNKEPEATKGETEVTKEDIVKAVSEVLAPLSERIGKIEKFKGISKQEDGIDQAQVKKSNSVFTGINI